MTKVYVGKPENKWLLDIIKEAIPEGEEIQIVDSEHMKRKIQEAIKGAEGGAQDMLSNEKNALEI